MRTNIGILKLLSLCAALLIAHQITAQEFIHPTDIVTKVKKTMKTVETYEADFRIITKTKKKTKTTRGRAYYKKPGKIHFAFREPSGDKIISNGKTMWIYIHKLKAVGIQELNSVNSKGVASVATHRGIMSIFSRYHYNFDTTDQPRQFGSKSYFVLSLKEKVASGGFSTMKIYIGSKTNLIEKIEAENDHGKVVSLEFQNIRINTDLPGSLFYFKVEGNIKPVNNPLTID